MCTKKDICWHAQKNLTALDCKLKVEARRCQGLPQNNSLSKEWMTIATDSPCYCAIISRCYLSRKYEWRKMTYLVFSILLLFGQSIILLDFPKTLIENIIRHYYNTRMKNKWKKRTSNDVYMSMSSTHPILVQAC